MASPKPLPSLDYLRGHFSYDPVTGIFTGLSDAVNRFRFDKDGYLVTTLEGRVLKLHRLAYYFFNQVDPGEFLIDHKNGVITDNWGENLRLATSAQNSQNLKTYNTNTSTQKGVHWVKENAVWRIRFSAYGKRYSLGTSPSFEVARKIYLDAVEKIHGDFALHTSRKELSLC